MAVLEPHCADDTDAMGTLAGRLKRRWLVERRRADVERAMELYQNAYDISSSRTTPDHHQAYYHGINLAFLNLAYGGDTSAAEEMARKVLNHAEQASHDRSKEHWRLAAEGDALLIVGETDEATARHAAAVGLLPDPWQALSMEDQTLRLADLLGLSDAEIRRISDIYQPKALTAEP
jgi:hypothetical protein